MPSINVQSTEGYWGKTSSTIDWCEENYAVTHYIAEFWNTLSNLMMIVPPLLAVLHGLYQGAERRLIMCHLALLVVGVGSWCFHMTLRYSMQLLDELPMIWGSFVLLYSIVEMEKPLKTHNRHLQAVLLLYCLMVTVIYLLNKSPLFFQVSYVLMVIAMTLGASRFMLKYGWQLKIHLLLLAMGSYGLGALLWGVDNHYCTSIRGLRKGLLGAVGPATQFHAWWHLLAGFGTYMSIIFTFHSRYTIHAQRPQIKLLFGLWPYLDVDWTVKSI